MELTKGNISNIAENAWNAAHEPDCPFEACAALKDAAICIRELEARSESLEKENKYLNDGCAELEAQIKYLEKDAARYRWLRIKGKLQQ